MAKIDFDLRVYLIESSLEGIIKYYKISQRSINDEILELKNKFLEDTKGINEIDDIHYCDMQDSIISYTEEMEETFIRNLNYSFISLIYSFFENALNEFCIIIKEKKGIVKSFSQIKGEGIIRAKDYIVKEAQIDFPVNTNSWNELLKLNKIRNCIVHASGNINKMRNKEELLNVINSISNIRFEDNCINMSKEYVEEIIEHIRFVLSYIFTKNVEYGFYTTLKSR